MRGSRAIWSGIAYIGVLTVGLLKRLWEVFRCIVHLSMAAGLLVMTFAQNLRQAAEKHKTTTAIISTAIILIILFFLIPLSLTNYMNSSVRLQFWAQVFAGNWPGIKPDIIDTFEYSVSAIWGVLLNNGLIAIIIIFAWQWIKAERRRLMDLAKAITSRDRWILNTIRAEFLSHAIPDEQKKSIISSVTDAFNKGKQDWADDYLPILVGGDEKEAESVLKMMQLKK
jgi:hypothetical protein